MFQQFVSEASCENFSVYTVEDAWCTIVPLAKFVCPAQTKNEIRLNFVSGEISREASAKY